ILRRITQLAPMDTSARKQLIDQLILRGETDNAIREYIELADIFRRLADLALARKTYATALRLTQQSNADRAWSINLLQNMADIDMQRLDWKQAIRVYEQIRTLRPDDEDIRRNLIDLNLKLGQPAQANVEVESYLSHLQSSNRGAQAIAFLEGLLADRPDESVLKRALANAYQHAGRIEDAVLQLDNLADALLTQQKKEEAMVVINQILLLNPPNAEQYRQLLQQIQL
ncbi:MAG TPA: tetratricopeptide repeat protein, partial [Anaerolineales bacterium]|nr:tetratricopeptide repeat protein [Anaerolineales bacterium]